MSWQKTIVLDKTVYSLAVIQRTAYALASSLTILISNEGEQFVLNITPALIVGMDSLVPDPAHAHDLVLRNLNDFALRERIAQETSVVREVLVRAALQGAGV